MDVAICSLARDHDPRVVATAVLLALLTLGVAAELWRQSRNSSGVRSRLWMSATCFSIGCGIWSVHNMSMLAYLPRLGTGFEPIGAAASLLTIVAASFFSFSGGVRARSPRQRAGFGALLGAGIVVTHYLGMLGFAAPGRLEWSTGTIAVSAAACMALCAAGFLVGLNATRSRPILSGGALITSAVAVAHFGGMSAITFHYDPTMHPPMALLSRSTMAPIVVVVLGLVLGLGALSLLLKDRDRRRAMRRLKLLSESSFEGVVVLSRGRIYDLNPTFAEMTGHSREDLIGRRFHEELFTPDDHQSWATSDRCEGRLDRNAGSPLPVEVLRRAIGAADTDVIVAVRDLTERRQREESLSLLFERNPAPVWLADPSTGYVIAGNLAASRLYGYSQEAFRGLRSRQLLPDDEYEVVRSLRREGQIRYSPDRVWRHLKSNGEEILVLPYVETIIYEGRMAMLTTVFDVTERERSSTALVKAKEAAEAANQAKSDFLANMSHEIRTPLNGILGMAQAIAQDELSPVQRGRLGLVKQSGQTLLSILNDILDISKIESGDVSLNCAPFDLIEVLTNTHLTFSDQVQSKGLSFTLHVSDEVAGTYTGDATRTQRIVWNLLSNAIKFTDAGSVSVGAQRAPSGLVRIAVADTGQGIEADQLPAIFSKFVQGDPSATRRHGGAGLGLAIARELAQSMGGDIEVTSVAGEGSTFTLVLPLEPVAVSPAEPLAEPEDRDIPPGGPDLKILVAEDNPVNQLVLKTLLHQAGLDPTVVCNGQEAVDAWRAQDWDIILMDVQMPVMDGPTAARTIRSEEAEGRRPSTPILAVTANFMRHQVEDYRAAGMNGHVGKPIDTADLFDALSVALEGAPDQQAPARTTGAAS